MDDAAKADNTETTTDAPVENTEAVVDNSTTKTDQPKEFKQPNPDASGYDLDLDLLQPQTKKVKLGDKVYDVYPPRVKDIANLARIAGELQDTTSENLQQKVSEMLNTFGNIMPGLKEDGVDLSLEQLTALFSFVNSMASPTENSALKAMGVEPTAEKKITPA